MESGSCCSLFESILTKQARGRGKTLVRITSEDAIRRGEKGQKTAVIENKDASEDEPKKAFFDIRGAGGWIDGVKTVRPSLAVRFIVL